jgi:hypothetical protein
MASGAKRFDLVDVTAKHAPVRVTGDLLDTPQFRAALRDPRLLEHALKARTHREQLRRMHRL